MKKSILVASILVFSMLSIGIVVGQPENIPLQDICGGPIPGLVQDIVPNLPQDLIDNLPVPNFVKVLFGGNC